MGSDTKRGARAPCAKWQPSSPVRLGGGVQFPQQVQLWVVFVNRGGDFDQIVWQGPRFGVKRVDCKIVNIIKRYGRRLTFSSNNSAHGGYNDFRNPDAFASALKDVWDRSKLPMNKSYRSKLHFVKPVKCTKPPCAAARCKLANEGRVCA